MLSGRPLLDNATDADLFVGRVRELRQLSEAADNGFNMLVHGGPGAGKTSLLRQWQLLRRRSGRLVVYVRVEGLTEPAAVLASAVEVVAELGGMRNAVWDVRGDSVGDARDQLSRFAEAVTTLRASQQDGPGANTSTDPVTLIFDDVTGTAGHGLFGRMRDELWELPVQWVVAARSTEVAALTSPPADAFFDARLEVTVLDRTEIAAMLERRAGKQGGHWAGPVYDVLGGNPRAVLSLARDAITSGEGLTRIPTDDLDAYAARKQAIAAMGRPEAMLAAELERLGAASASDDALLAALGWTRSRAVQVLNRLHAAGLVVADEVRGQRGRPRKVFRLAPVTSDGRRSPNGAVGAA